jgi:hypothetical protein
VLVGRDGHEGMQRAGDIAPAGQSDWLCCRFARRTSHRDDELNLIRGAARAAVIAACPSADHTGVSPGAAPYGNARSFQRAVS